MNVLDWLLDSDPAIRRQVLRDLLEMRRLKSSKRNVQGRPRKVGEPDCWRYRVMMANGPVVHVSRRTA